MKVVITTKNEADTIGKLIASLDYDVIIVDENSSDGTERIAQEMGASVLPLPKGFGIGPCLMSGWFTALDDEKCQRIVQMDAGGSHDPGQIARLLAPQCDIVIGSRFVPGAKYEGRPLRALASRLFAIGCNIITGKSINDWTSGYRSFSRQALSILLEYDYKATMHGWQAEVLMRAVSRGLSIMEVPITYHAGKSSFNWRIAKEAIGVWTSH